MNKEFTEKLIEILQEKLNTNKKQDLIEEVFNDRLEEFHKAIIQNKDYKEYMKKINKIDKEITGKFKNRWEIVEIIEKYNNATCELEYLCEKLMYKFGVLDGLLLITQSSESIKDFFKENKFMKLKEEINE